MNQVVESGLRLASSLAAFVFFVFAVNFSLNMQGPDVAGDLQIHYLPLLGCVLALTYANYGNAVFAPIQKFFRA